MSVVDAGSLAAWQEVLESRRQADGAAGLVVGFFWAEFHEPSKRGGQMDTVFTALQRKYAETAFVRVNVEEATEVADLYPITDVPSFVFLRKGKLVDALEGALPADLAKKIDKYLTSDGAESKIALEEKMRRLIVSA